MNTLPSITDLARLLQCYFCSYLINQRHFSQHTIKSYRDTFRLLLPFVAAAQNKAVSLLTLNEIDAPIILSFLQYLEQKRGCTAQTRNVRRSAIRSFLNYVAVEEPQHIASIQRVLAIPDKRTDRSVFEYLDKREIEALLATQDMTTWTGRRDHIMLLTLYNTGARVS
jgi:integrase/recombinase XerD